MVTFPPDDVSATGDVRMKEGGLATRHFVCDLKIKKKENYKWHPNHQQHLSVSVKRFFINDLAPSTDSFQSSSSVSTMHLFNILRQEGAIPSTDLV